MAPMLALHQEVDFHSKALISQLELSTETSLGNLKLYLSITQTIPLTFQIAMVNVEQVSNIGETKRGSKGFEFTGST
ncbi:hypothetical protein AX16_002203 [Volvariella volvacea WC 439]|nr:hypothetical protein AX16_002203 [Volvariella volvacea WC 439]